MLHSDHRNLPEPVCPHTKVILAAALKGDRKEFSLLQGFQQW